MPEPLDLSPPDIPEPTFLETLLRYGLFCGAIFQLICILAIIFPGSKSHDSEPDSSPEVKPTEVQKKPKPPPAPTGKKQKKETKKKR